MIRVPGSLETEATQPPWGPEVMDGRPGRDANTGPRPLEHPTPPRVASLELLRGVGGSPGPAPLPAGGKGPPLHTEEGEDPRGAPSPTPAPHLPETRAPLGPAPSRPPSADTGRSGRPSPAG